jgi:hypothetical protein
MDIIVLSIVAGMVACVGFWLASRPTKPVGKHEDGQHHPA